MLVNCFSHSLPPPAVLALAVAEVLGCVGENDGTDVTLHPYSSRGAENVLEELDYKGHIVFVVTIPLPL